MEVIQRIAEHFGAAAFSIQQSRPFDGVCIVVSGCLAALADAIVRKLAIDEPAEASSHLSGKTVSGRQLGHPGYGISISTFATQSETIESHYPELCIARTAVLDYFQSPAQRRLQKLFTWEVSYELKPTKHLIMYLREVAREMALGTSTPHLLLVDGLPQTSHAVINDYLSICLTYSPGNFTNTCIFAAVMVSRFSSKFQFI